MKKDELEELARQLEAHQDYRVVRRLRARPRYRPDPEDTAQLRRGLFVDVETTGLDAATDAIIQLALVPFTFTRDGSICEVGDGYEQYDDPGRPIPEKVTQLTGIRDEDVAGQEIDWSAVADYAAAADLVIAHNAGFDRRFVEARCEAFEQRAWACSMREIPWSEEGLESPKQEYLAYRYGFFYDGHRAGADCLAGIHLLTRSLPASGRPALAALLDNARRTTYRLWALNSPFEAKDLLRARGYRWNNGTDGRHKAWYAEVDEEDCASEQEYLETEIYKRDIKLPIDKITAFNRYSDRA
ncbi:MAG: 3'-5' exonuclease [Gammaproteobacteria bacterium]|nr:3'-5' exonuclease [Gammaproteobacteria bacterium]NNF61382.1 3'-5' exonuclease [Gammaproteobacteria bacterium]